METVDGVRWSRSTVNIEGSNGRSSFSIDFDVEYKHERNIKTKQNNRQIKMIRTTRNSNDQRVDDDELKIDFE